MRSPALILTLVAGCVGLGACRVPGGPPRSALISLPAPTKDEVLWVDGRTLPIGSFLQLRALLGNPDIKTSVSLATETLAVQNDATRKGVRLALEDALLLARYASGEITLSESEAALRAYLGSYGAWPSAWQMKERLAGLVARSVVQQNPLVLAELR